MSESLLWGVGGDGDAGVICAGEEAGFAGRMERVPWGLPLKGGSGKCEEWTNVFLSGSLRGVRGTPGCGIRGRQDV